MSLIFKIEKVLFNLNEWQDESQRESYLSSRNLKVRYGNQKQNPMEDSHYISYRQRNQPKNDEFCVKVNQESGVVYCGYYCHPKFKVERQKRKNQKSSDENQENQEKQE